MTNIFISSIVTELFIFSTFFSANYGNLYLFLNTYLIQGIAEHQNSSITTKDI